MTYKVLHPANFSTASPKTYFEKFYSQVADSISTRPYGCFNYDGKVERALKERLMRYGATIKKTKNQNNYLLRFQDEKKYFMFVMKWS